MWLPAPIYERVPQFWLLLGLLFFAFGLYLGFEFELIFAYLALGSLCVARSIWIFLARRVYRAQAAESKQEPATPQASPATVEHEPETVEHESPKHSEGAPSF